MIVVDIKLSSLLKPEDLPHLLWAVEEALGGAGGREPVVVSGRLPVWAYAALTHLLHPRPWVATFDPRLGGGVVVMSHHPTTRVGEVVPTEGAEVLEIVF